MNIVTHFETHCNARFFCYQFPGTLSPQLGADFPVVCYPSHALSSWLTTETYVKRSTYWVTRSLLELFILKTGRLGVRKISILKAYSVTKWLSLSSFLSTAWRALNKGPVGALNSSVNNFLGELDKAYLICIWCIQIHRAPAKTKRLHAKLYANNSLEHLAKPGWTNFYNQEYNWVQFKGK